MFGLKGMHMVKKGVTKSKTIPEDFFGEEELSYYRNLTFWDRT